MSEQDRLVHQFQKLEQYYLEQIKDLQNANQRLRGYVAAEIVLNDLIEDAKEKVQPYAKREGRKLDWWKGYYEGLVAADCLLVFGRFPSHNATRIEKVLDNVSQGKKSTAE